MRKLKVIEQHINIDSIPSCKLVYDWPKQTHKQGEGCKVCKKDEFKNGKDNPCPTCLGRFPNWWETV